MNHQTIINFDDTKINITSEQFTPSPYQLNFILNYPLFNVHKISLKSIEFPKMLYPNIRGNDNPSFSTNMLSFVMTKSSNHHTDAYNYYILEDIEYDIRRLLTKINYAINSNNSSITSGLVFDLNAEDKVIIKSVNNAIQYVVRDSLDYYNLINHTTLTDYPSSSLFTANTHIENFTLLINSNLSVMLGFGLGEDSASPNAWDFNISSAPGNIFRAKFQYDLNFDKYYWLDISNISSQNTNYDGSVGKFKIINNTYDNYIYQNEYNSFKQYIHHKNHSSPIRSLQVKLYDKFNIPLKVSNYPGAQTFFTGLSFSLEFE